MGGGGSILSMITSLNNNAKLKGALHKKKWNKPIHQGKYPLKFKEVPEEELTLIKNRIREKAKKDKRRTIILTVLIIIPIVVFLTWRIHIMIGNSN